MNAQDAGWIEMKDYPLVALVVPVHNNKEDTKEFLESIRQVTYANYEVIIIDDGSTDGTEEMLKREYPEVIVLKGDGNLWWSQATNMGIEKAIEIGADYIIWGGMNDTVVNREFISSLVHIAEKNARSIVTPKICSYHEPTRIQAAGWDIHWLRGGFRQTGLGEVDKGQYDSQRDVKAAALGVLVNTSFFQDIGLMDHKSFPQYWADVDFTYRAYKQGYRIIYQPKSIIWHKDRATVQLKSPRATSFLSRLIYLTTDIRSLQNLRQVTKFYFRHCPKCLLPYMALRYVGWLIKTSIKPRKSGAELQETPICNQKR